MQTKAETWAKLRLINHVKLYFKRKEEFDIHMKISPFRRDNGAKADTQFVCKECKMTFQSKDSLDLHKRKSGHFTGLIYFGKHDK